MKYTESPPADRQIKSLKYFQEIWNKGPQKAHLRTLSDKAMLKFPMINAVITTLKRVSRAFTIQKKISSDENRD